MTPPAIVRGLSGLRGVAGCVIEDGPTFHADVTVWVVTFTIQRTATNRGFVPAKTRWCALIDGNYPYGGVAIHPATDAGITATFPHQARNTPTASPRAWRNGKLCLDTPIAGERYLTLLRDPIGDAEARLRWHVERAKRWLLAAADDQLLSDGDPFELPATPPHKPAGRWERLRVVHDESPSSFEAWRTRVGSCGTVSVGEVPDIGGVLAGGRFFDRNREAIREWRGRSLVPLNDVSGFWWLWPEPIVLPPWEAPATWGELRRIAKAQRLDADAVLRWMLPSLRGANLNSVLLLGYPIAVRVGQPVTEVHWDTLSLPPVPAAAGKPPNGFRSNALGWWHRDRHETFPDERALQYLRTENWAPERLQARGRLPTEVRNLRIALLGVGALGSGLADMLVRAGVSELALVDNDLLLAGNVCRHTATLVDVGNAKVEAVARRLRQLSPAVRVTEVTKALGGGVTEVVGQLDEYDVIIDCTASDEVLMMLAAAWWSIPRIFASFSMGYGGKRLFSFGVSDHRFPHDEFTRSVRPWLEHETNAWAESGEVLEGAGCWSPLFPARCDDVALAAAVCVKEVETFVSKRPRSSRLRVFAQSSTDDGFQGFAPESLPAVACAVLSP